MEETSKEYSEMIINESTRAQGPLTNNNKKASSLDSLIDINKNFWNPLESKVQLKSIKQ
jgi:hypothetical protein